MKRLNDIKNNLLLKPNSKYLKAMTRKCVLLVIITLEEII